MGHRGYEPKDWTKATRHRKTKNSGVHIYINGDTLAEALEKAGLRTDVDIEVKGYPTSGSGNHARIIIDIREVVE